MPNPDPPGMKKTAAAINDCILGKMNFEYRTKESEPDGMNWNFSDKICTENNEPVSTGERHSIQGSSDVRFNFLDGSSQIIHRFY